MEAIWIALVSLGTIGAVGAIILYFVAQRFYVYEDPRVGQVEEILPAANCGGCGFPGCKGFASACVAATSLEALMCPVGGNTVMKQVGDILGLETKESVPRVAVLRCNGSCGLRPQTSRYDGAASCAVEASLYRGETDCAFGCLGKGDCQVVCPFEALIVNPNTGLPEIEDAKCTGCGACVAACPRLLLELRKQGPKSRRVYVACANKEKGVVARKSCQVACIGCSKCQKECPFEAITITNNLAYIDDNKCRLCRKCVTTCPTSSILELNFPPRKIVTDL